MWEECAKKYSVDATRINGQCPHFICRECGHMVVVVKPEQFSLVKTELDFS